MYIRHTCPGPSKGREKARYFAPKGTQGTVRDELEGSPRPKDKVQEIVRGVTGAQDRKSKVHKMKGARMGCGDGDGEWYGRWWTV